jgi:hypothetical protein
MRGRNSLPNKPPAPSVLGLGTRATATATADRVRALSGVRYDLTWADARERGAAVRRSKVDVVAARQSGTLLLLSSHPRDGLLRCPPTHEPKAHPTATRSAVLRTNHVLFGTILVHRVPSPRIGRRVVCSPARGQQAATNATARRRDNKDRHRLPATVQAWACPARPLVGGVGCRNAHHPRSAW